MVALRAQFLVLTALLVSGCGRFDPASAPQPGVAMQDGGFVLTGQSLEDGSGDLLSALVGKIPSLRMRRMRERCPQITLRNAVSSQSLVNPHVYVDGARATDTCVLEMLSARDVERVEIFPAGVASRPGYGTHAHGLILVFMRGAPARPASDTTAAGAPRE